MSDPAEPVAELSNRIDRIEATLRANHIHDAGCPAVPDINDFRTCTCGLASEE